MHFAYLFSLSYNPVVLNIKLSMTSCNPWIARMRLKDAKSIATISIAIFERGSELAWE